MEIADKGARDNHPRGVRRRPSSDGFPKNVSRSKSLDQIPNKPGWRHPGFSAPSPAKRRLSRENIEREPERKAKKTDKMMAAPLRRKASFDSELPADTNEESRHKSHGALMPPRP